MLNKLSFSVSRVRILRTSDEGETIKEAVGSCFFWRDDQSTYLVTNWHNLTGINPESNKLMDGWIPNRIEFSLCSEIQNFGEIAINERSFHSIDLYHNNVPVWIEHDTGRHVDCAAIKIDREIDTAKVIHVNDYHFYEKLIPHIGMDCFIIGYPKGLSADNNTPIWKRGSIASEPLLNCDSKPIVLIDTASRKGMSGSPVITRFSGVYTPFGEGGNSKVGTMENFLGIYSGRIGDDNLGVQLGRVWKSNVIEEIIAAKKAGIDPNAVM